MGAKSCDVDRSTGTRVAGNFENVRAVSPGRIIASGSAKWLAEPDPEASCLASVKRLHFDIRNIAMTATPPWAQQRAQASVQRYFFRLPM